MQYYNSAMPCRMIIILCAVCVLSGCAHEASSYRKAEGRVDDAQQRAFAGCRAKAEPLASAGGLGGLAYHQAISDCMKAQGYEKL